MAIWVFIGLVEWALGTWGMNSFDPLSLSLGYYVWYLFSQLGIYTLAGCAFWAIRITLIRTGELPAGTKTE